MRKNAQKVVEAFLSRRSAVGDSKRTISTDGERLMSYHTMIAFNAGSEVHMLDPAHRHYSNTTMSQLRALEMLANKELLVKHADQRSLDAAYSR